MGGLRAAHELAERGFAVTVYEKRALPGGKARSYPDARGLPPSTASASSRPSTATCRTRWRGSRRAARPRATGWSAPSGSCSRGPTARTSSSRPRTRRSRWTTWRVLARFVFDAATQLGVPAVDVAWLLERLFTLLASCDERRVEQWDRQSWWDYVQADKRSPEFRRYLADGLTRTLVAARATRDERAHGRADPRPAAARPLARGRARRPRARRADLRRLDLAVGGAPGVARRDAAARRAGRGPAGARRPDRVARPSAGRRSRPTSTSPRCPSRSCAGCSRPSCAPPSRA